MARQPRRTPSSAPNGISSALAPEKPTTSQGMASRPVSITTRAPTDMAWIGPGDLDHQAAHADHAAVNLDAVELGDLLGQRLHASSLWRPR